MPEVTSWVGVGTPPGRVEANSSAVLSKSNWNIDCWMADKDESGGGKDKGQRTNTRSCLGRMNIARQWHWVYITFLFSASPLEYHPPPISNTLPHLSTAPNGHAKRPLIVLLLPRIHFDLLAVVRKQFSTNNLPAISVGLLRWYINFVLLYTGKKYFIIDRKTMLRTYDFTNNNSGQPITFDK